MTLLLMMHQGRYLSMYLLPDAALLHHVRERRSLLCFAMLQPGGLHHPQHS